MEQDENGNVIVARVLAGSTIDKENLMHPGDVILEVNGVNVKSAEELKETVSECKSTLRIRLASKNDPDLTVKTQQVGVENYFVRLIQSLRILRSFV